jgi:hypothetical protein
MKMKEKRGKEAASKQQQHQKNIHTEAFFSFFFDEKGKSTFCLYLSIQLVFTSRGVQIVLVCAPC